MPTELRELVILQSRGAFADSTDADRRGGAGPADARTVIVDGHPVMIPTMSRSALHSEYALSSGGGQWQLKKNGEVLFHAGEVPTPKFYQGRTRDGVPYHQIARLHGADGLGSTVIQECFRYNDPHTRCRFCAIGASLSRGQTVHTKTPEQLAEVASAAKAMDGLTHVVLTSGTTEDRDAGARYLGRCAQAVKQASGLPVEVQFEPLLDRGLYARLKEMGVDDIGLHVESFDQKVRERMTPGKATVSLEEYFDAFAVAVEVFGRNKVSTYVILGLGEDEAATVAACERAAALGVYPFVVPLRPLSDSYLANAAAPDPEYLFRMYTRIGGILASYGLTASGSSAGCVRCRACSPLQFTEIKPAPPPEPRQPHVELAVASTPAQVADYFEIRREVFVGEQGLFETSDRDAHDDEAIPIVALVDGRVAGVVRCYPDADGVWYGGRLAVRKDYRVGFNLGPLLVRKAVETMRLRGDVRRFLATVQMPNVRFFQRLGWVRTGAPLLIQGMKHQTMEKPLEGDEQ